jgi:hypothetical protein
MYTYDRRTASRPTFDGLLDFLLNGLEHEPSAESAVSQMVEWGYDPEFWALRKVADKHNLMFAPPKETT